MNIECLVKDYLNYFFLIHAYVMFIWLSSCPSWFFVFFVLQRVVRIDEEHKVTRPAQRRIQENLSKRVNFKRGENQEPRYVEYPKGFNNKGTW